MVRYNQDISTYRDNRFQSAIYVYDQVTLKLQIQSNHSCHCLLRECNVCYTLLGCFGSCIECRDVKSCQERECNAFREVSDDKGRGAMPR